MLFSMNNTSHSISNHLLLVLSLFNFFSLLLLVIIFLMIHLYLLLQTPYLMFQIQHLPLLYLHHPTFLFFCSIYTIILFFLDSFLTTSPNTHIITPSQNLPLPTSPLPRHTSRPHKPPTWLHDYICQTSSSFSSHWCNLACCFFCSLSFFLGRYCSFL